MKITTDTPLLTFSVNPKKLTDALSATVVAHEHLWVASDELTSVERLTLNSAGDTFGDQRSFDLHEFIALPATGKKKPNGKDLDQEIDIEGMDFSEGYLWLVGSHSIKRKKIDKDDDKPASEIIEKLSRTEREGNRFVLARIPVEKSEETTEVELCKTSSNGVLKAAQVPCSITGNTLIESIAGGDEVEPDKHLSPFLEIPGKDNGFDIEGLVVAGNKIFLGLRGPVLRGWAVILELQPEANAEGDLVLPEIGPDGRGYRKHFVNLGGLGLRELCKDGSDLLILAGPTMNLDGPTAIYRWKDATLLEDESVVLDLGQRQTIPSGDGEDHAEGMVLLTGANAGCVLIVYDSPGKRKINDHSVKADVIRLEV